jgi:large subunit ribosomal protein L23
MKFAQDIILKPIITEASMIGAADEENRKYTFSVAVDANKPEIALAVEQLFKVKVRKVNTINMRPKPRSYGKYNGFRPGWKKAVVTLQPGSKSIEFFDGMM